MPIHGVTSVESEALTTLANRFLFRLSRHQAQSFKDFAEQWEQLVLGVVNVLAF